MSLCSDLLLLWAFKIVEAKSGKAEDDGEDEDVDEVVVTAFDVVPGDTVVVSLVERDVATEVAWATCATALTLVV